jgi:hypothetical protein
VQRLDRPFVLEPEPRLVQPGALEACDEPLDVTLVVRQGTGEDGLGRAGLEPLESVIAQIGEALDADQLADVGRAAAR